MTTASSDFLINAPSLETYSPGLLAKYIAGAQLLSRAPDIMTKFVRYL
jgi:hypothetical protein